MALVFVDVVLDLLHDLLLAPKIGHYHFMTGCGSSRFVQVHQSSQFTCFVGRMHFGMAIMLIFEIDLPIDFA